MPATKRFLVPYLLFLVICIAGMIDPLLTMFHGVQQPESSGGISPAGLVTGLISLVAGVAAVLLLARGKPVRQAIASVMLAVSVLSWPLAVVPIRAAATGGNIMLVVALSHVLSAVLFFLLLSAWVVAASHAPWMFAVAVVATIANIVLSGVVSVVATGTATALQASPGVLAGSVVLPALVKIEVFTGVVLVGRYMTAGAPNADGGSGFSASDRIGW